MTCLPSKNEIILATKIGNIIVLDWQMAKVLQFLSMPNDEKQYATYIDSQFIGTSAGILY